MRHRRTKNGSGLRSFSIGEELISAIQKRRDVNWSEYVRRCLREALGLKAAK